MSEGLIVSLLVGAVLLGIGSAAFLVMRNPSFWANVASEIASKVWPQIKEVLAKRLTPEEEEEMRRMERQGRGDEWLREVWMRRKKKGRK